MLDQRSFAITFVPRYHHSCSQKGQQIHVLQLPSNLVIKLLVQDAGENNS